MKRYALVIPLLMVLIFALVGCGSPPAQSAGGVKVHTADSVKTDDKGTTIEQRNINDRIQTDNSPGALKFLYVIAPESGTVILFSPVKGKVTSSGKSLTPRTISAIQTSDLPSINIGGRTYYTNQLPNEDGTYSNGGTEYIYWQTPGGVHHQHFLTGGQIVHISDQALVVKSVVITIEDKKP